MHPVAGNSYRYIGLTTSMQGKICKCEQITNLLAYMLIDGEMVLYTIHHFANFWGNIKQPKKPRLKTTSWK